MKRKLLNFKKVISTVFVGALTLTSCTKNTTISGKAININNGEGIADTYVYLLLGEQSTNGLLGSEGDDEGYVSTITDGNGNFSIEGKSDILEILGVKEGYTWIKTTDAGLTGNQISPGDYTNYQLFFEGVTMFNSPFIREDVIEDKDDSELIITLLSYDNISESLYPYSARERTGVGPHYFPNSSLNVRLIGDRHLRYKLEFTTPDGWETVIDSVFIPTSSEVYDEPIYY